MTTSEPTGICEELTFNAFFKAHIKTLRNYLFFKFGNQDKAEDMAQEAFIALWNNCHKVSPEKAKSFLYTVANNTALNDVTHQKVVLKFAQNHAQATETIQSPEYLMEEEQFKQKLERAIQQLTEAQRTAFLLHRIEGKKYYEIAEILGISAKAVEKRIHGALLSLRSNIEGIR
ncbi:MAG: RNA polymerase subunit sigma-70 [Flavobacterium sp. BFFFF2]|nr:MAG: RNA polymerase subunit sigma-70 [Flavobacterium sp. BFFFF2]